MIRWCRKVHNFQFYMLYTSPYIITMSNFRKMRWARDAGLSHTQKDEKVIQLNLLIEN